MKAWIARDRDERLWLYTTKPHKESDIWNGVIGCNAKLDDNELPSVKWEDKEPTEVEIIIKPKKK